VKLQPIVAAVVVGLFLYWVVQDPLGAADAIRQVATWAATLVGLVAQRLVQFLNALT
jgi:hypothetical protein